MNSSNDWPFRQWATINQTDRFTTVGPLSGYRRCLPEDEVLSAYLEPDATEIALGRALLEALGKSRFIYPDDEPDFFDADRIIAADKRWEQDFIKRYGYKTKHAAYRNMLYCQAQRCEGEISIRPHRRGSKSGYWWDLPADKTVIIPETTDPGILGAAVKLALSHCC